MEKDNSSTSLKKKGQITIFIILGAVLLLLVLGALFFVQQGKEVEFEIEDIEKIPLELRSIAVFTDRCIEDVSVPGIFLLADQGGFIYSYPDIIGREFKETAYHLEYKKKTGPDIEFMEQELARFIENSLYLCVSEFENLSYLNLSFGDIKAEPIIADSEVIINIDYPITITSEGRTSSVNRFRKTLPFRLGHLVSTKEELISHITSNQGTLDLNQLLGYDAEVRITPAEQDTLIYSLLDDLSVSDEKILRFNFAVKQEFIENEYPVVEEFENIIAYSGQNFTYRINAADPEDDILTYTAETAMFSIDDGGLIEFVPTPADIGSYNISIIVSDSVNEVENILRLDII